MLAKQQVFDMLPQKTNVLMQYKEWVKGLTLICSYCMLHSSISRSGSGNGGSSDNRSNKNNNKSNIYIGIAIVTTIKIMYNNSLLHKHKITI